MAGLGSTEGSTTADLVSDFIFNLEENKKKSDTDRKKLETLHTIAESVKQSLPDSAPAVKKALEGIDYLKDGRMTITQGVLDAKHDTLITALKGMSGGRRRRSKKTRKPKKSTKRRRYTRRR